MVIASIDLKGGRVVQLKNGKDTVIERDDAFKLIDDFNIYGEVAVIDLDAALGNVEADGTTVNTELLQSLLRRGDVRTGGGIRSVKRAKELIALGAQKVIVGSAAFNPKGAANGGAGNSGGASGEGFLNTTFLEELIATIGKERIIISVDAINGVIAVKGWTESAGVDLLAGAQAAEKYCSELLFTCVEREGCLSGMDMAAAKKLREAVSCRLVVAGGVSSAEEIAELEKLGCDVQLGMALYTGKVKLADTFIGCLNWQKTPLVPVIAQAQTGEVLMLGYANREALEKTFASGKLTFWSRTRNVLWTKGEHSGNFLQVVKLRADCDRDTILATVVPHGPVCHTGSWTCFTSEAAPPYSLEFLYNIIAERFANPRPGSYTATLDDQRVREKIMEEAEELTDEAETKDDLVWEFADLLYFMSVLMYKEKITWNDVLAELDKRHKK